MREYPFELRLCATLEAHRDGIVGRQLGGGVVAPGARVLDVVHVAPGPEFARRVRIGPDTIPQGALEAEVGTGSFVPLTEAINGSPERARSVAERAATAGFLERERRNGRSVVRQTTPYPEWFGRLTAVENKPDLDRPGDMARQLRFDVALGVFDRIILATADHVTGAHLNRLPADVGVWRFDPATGERTVIREPTLLDTGEGGVEIRAEHALRTDVDLVGTTAIRRARRRIAERAWGRGWRPTDLPACGNCEPTEAALPHCEYFERLVAPASECGPTCPGHHPAPPPDANPEHRRAERTAWDPDAEGFAREQVGLDRFE